MINFVSLPGSRLEPLVSNPSAHADLVRDDVGEPLPERRPISQQRSRRGRDSIHARPTQPGLTRCKCSSSLLTDFLKSVNFPIFQFNKYLVLLV